MNLLRWFSRSNKAIAYELVIPPLEEGNYDAVKSLMWGEYKVKYLKDTIGLVQGMKRGAEDKGQLTIHKKIRKGNFELAIFHQPWSPEKIPYSPLIFDLRNGKIVGIVLPFNELHGLISSRDGKDIGDLGVEWVKFTFPYNFGKQGDH
jgi:hypothetical protein